MKNGVNLYHPQFHPKLRLLTLSIVIIVWIFTTLCCGLLYFYLMSGQQNLHSELTKLEKNMQQQQILITELNTAIDNLKVDPKLLLQVEKQQQLISMEKRVLEELDGQDRKKSNSYSNLMIDLASQNQNGLWLTHINLDGMSVLIEGSATNSAIVPKWLSLLGQTNYFEGQKFAETRLYRDPDQQLSFIISTGNELGDKEGSKNE